MRPEKKEYSGSKVSTNITNIQNCHIDYEKLADAIVEAEKRAKTKTLETTTLKKKTSLFTAIWYIFRGKQSPDGQLSVAPFAIVIGVLYRTISLTGLIALVYFIVVSISFWKQQSWYGTVVSNCIAILIEIVLWFAALLYMIVLWGAANDIKEEKDKNYIVSIFSGLVSVAALVVAVIALTNSIY